MTRFGEKRHTDWSPSDGDPAKNTKRSRHNNLIRVGLKAQKIDRDSLGCAEKVTQKKTDVYDFKREIRGK